MTNACVNSYVLELYGKCYFYFVVINTFLKVKSFNQIYLY